jgi:16S rRNA (cytidine1402-2'-O)-methyltransferase
VPKLLFTGEQDTNNIVKNKKNIMKQGLYIVSTPIGNLGDISSRAIDTLKGCDAIICENPKHSLKLLLNLDIKKKLISLHDYNEQFVINKISDDLPHKAYCLISDAGSPLISDPGYKLVRFCIKNNIYVTTVPGASSVISALQLSSIPVNNYTFLGFLPKSKKEIVNFVQIIKKSLNTSVFFVSRHKILFLLELLSEEIEHRIIAVCKEITKLNEKVFIGPPHEVLKKFTENTKNSLGEFVIVVDVDEITKIHKDEVSKEVKDVIYRLLKKFSLTDTVEIVHKIVSIGKKEIYKKALEIQNEK